MMPHGHDVWPWYYDGNPFQNEGKRVEELLRWKMRSYVVGGWTVYILFNMVELSRPYIDKQRRDEIWEAGTYGLERLLPGWLLYTLYLRRAEGVEQMLQSEDEKRGVPEEHRYSFPGGLLTNNRLTQKQLRERMASIKEFAENPSPDQYAKMGDSICFLVVQDSQDGQESDENGQETDEDEDWATVKVPDLNMEFKVRKIPINGGYTSNPAVYYLHQTEEVVAE